MTYNKLRKKNGTTWVSVVQTGAQEISLYTKIKFALITLRNR
jgi:hypothetical protein